MIFSSLWSSETAPRMATLLLASAALAAGAQCEQGACSAALLQKKRREAANGSKWLEILGFRRVFPIFFEV